MRVLPLFQQRCPDDQLPPAWLAAASAHFGPTCDPARLQAFWTWWLRAALPAAPTATTTCVCQRSNAF